MAPSCAALTSTTVAAGTGLISVMQNTYLVKIDGFQGAIITDFTYKTTANEAITLFSKPIVPISR